MIYLQQDYSFLFNWGERSNSTYHVTHKGNPFPPLKKSGKIKSNQNPTHFFSEKSSFRNEPFQSLKKKEEEERRTKKKKDAQVQACSVAKKRLLEHTPPGTQWPAVVPEERGEWGVWERGEPSHRYLPCCCYWRVRSPVAPSRYVRQRERCRCRPCVGQRVCRLR